MEGITHFFYSLIMNEMSLKRIYHCKANCTVRKGSINWRMCNFFPNIKFSTLNYHTFYKKKTTKLTDNHITCYKYQ